MVRDEGGIITENNLQHSAPTQKRNEITIKFGRGLVSAPFTARTGRECVSIRIPHTDPADKTPWPSIIVAANHVHENRFGKGMWMKLPADGETKLYVPEITGQTPDGKNVYKNTVVKLPNTQIKAMLESYRERSAEATRAAAPDKAQPRKNHGMER